MARPARILTSEEIMRRGQAIEMKRAGASIDQIAERLDYPDEAACRRDISTAYNEVLRTSVEEARALDILRLDRMIMAVWPDACGGLPAAIDRAVKLIDMRAKLIGEYAPVQVEQVTLDAVEAEIKRLEGELGASARKAVSRARRNRNVEESE